jgi:hypothetical protein
VYFRLGPLAAPWVKQNAFSTFEGPLHKGLRPVLIPPVRVRYVVKQKRQPSLAAWRTLRR